MITHQQSKSLSEGSPSKGNLSVPSPSVQSTPENRSLDELSPAPLASALSDWRSLQLSLDVNDIPSGADMVQRQEREIATDTLQGVESWASFLKKALSSPQFFNQSRSEGSEYSIPVTTQLEERFESSGHLFSSGRDFLERERLIAGALLKFRGWELCGLRENETTRGGEFSLQFHRSEPTSADPESRLQLLPEELPLEIVKASLPLFKSYSLSSSTETHSPEFGLLDKSHHPITQFSLKGIDLQEAKRRIAGRNLESRSSSLSSIIRRNFDLVGFARNILSWCIEHFSDGRKVVKPDLRSLCGTISLPPYNKEWTFSNNKNEERNFELLGSRKLGVGCNFLDVTLRQVFPDANWPIELIVAGRHMDDCCPENDGKYSFRFWVHNNGTYHVYENLIIRPGPSYWGERYDHFSGKECYKMIENILGLYAKTVFRTPKSEGDWELVCRDSWGYCALKNRTPKSPEQRM